MFPHLSFPASVVHHYHHYLTPLSLHRARLTKSQVSIKQSTYFCLHSCGWTFAEGKKHRARRWPLSSWNHELESHVGAQHLFSFHIAFLAFPLSQITISELFPPQSLHLFFPTLRCQLVTSLHTALKRKKICQRGTLNFPHSKMYDATCNCSYNLCLPFSYSGWNVFTPVKVSPPLVRWFPSRIDFAVFSFRISDSSLSPESFPSTHKPFVMSFIISFWCPPENYTFCWRLPLIPVYADFPNATQGYLWHLIPQPFKDFQSLLFPILNPFLLEIFGAISTFLSKSWLTLASNFIALELCSIAPFFLECYIFPPDHD